MGLTDEAEAAGATGRPPGEDDVVARRDIRDPLPHSLDDAGAYRSVMFWSGGFDPSVVGTNTCGDWTTTADDGDASYSGRTNGLTSWPYFNVPCTVALPLLCAED